jgi:hypothetical protein
MRVQHWLPWCWHLRAFYICCEPARGIACQAAHNLQVRSLDTQTKNRHDTCDHGGRYTLGNLQAMSQKPVCNASSCRLHSEQCNTRSRRRDVVYSSVTGVPTGVLRSAFLGLFAAVHPATTEEYCGS